MRMSLQKIAGIALLIFVMLIILFVSFAPGQWYDKVAELVKPFSEHVFKLMHKQKEIQRGDIEIPKDIQDMFNNLKNDVEQEGNAPCLLKHRPFIKDFKKYQICFKNEVNEIYLFNEKRQLVDSQPITKKVCVVAGKKNNENVAENFLQWFIKGNSAYKNKDKFITPKEICITEKETIYFNEKLDEARELEDQNLLFKADDQHVCFFPTKDQPLDVFGKCDAGGYILDDDCLKDIFAGRYPQLKHCTTINPAMFFRNAYYGLRNEWERINSRFYYRGQDKRVAYTFTEDGLSYNDFQIVIEGPYAQFPEGKNGVYYSESVIQTGQYYGVANDWKYDPYGYVRTGRYEGRWKYEGQESEVPTIFKTAGINEDTKYKVFGPPRTQ